MNCRKDRDVIQYHTGRLTDRSEGTVYVKNVCIGGFVFMKKWETIREFIMITFATVIVAAAVFFFLMPSHVSVGSISGLAIVLGNFVPLKISAITFILNMFLLVLGFLLIGREFGAKTVYTSFLLPVVLAVFETAFPEMLPSPMMRFWI